jgi:hypothetical protein
MKTRLLTNLETILNSCSACAFLYCRRKMLVPVPVYLPMGMQASIHNWTVKEMTVCNEHFCIDSHIQFLFSLKKLATSTITLSINDK